jgi:hypothetical protein
VQTDDLQVYCDNLNMLHEDMTERFKDVLSLEVSDWIINPFSDNRGSGSHFELKQKFKKSYQEFWLQKEISARYPSLWGAPRCIWF